MVSSDVSLPSMIHHASFQLGSLVDIGQKVKVGVYQKSRLAELLYIAPFFPE